MFLPRITAIYQGYDSTLVEVQNEYRTTLIEVFNPPIRPRNYLFVLQPFPTTIPPTFC